MLYPLDVQHSAYRVHHILQLGGLRKILQVEGLQNTLFQFFALGGIVLGHKNRISCDRAPEGFRFQRRNLQRVFQRYSIQFDLNPPRGIVRIEEHVDPGQLADRLINNLGILGEFYGDGYDRDGRKLHRPAGFADFAPQASGRPRGLRRRIARFIDHLHRALQFLLRYE